jgi:NAD(P)-dependent dehydrogenase (short-subunit alcohol dehydrogenase family)
MNPPESEGPRPASSGLAGQVALITGAAHGQGRATALALAREGMHIAALDVARPLDYPGYAMGSADDLATLADECRALGVECLTFPADVPMTRPSPPRSRTSSRASAGSTSCSITRASAATAWRTS